MAQSLFHRNERSRLFIFTTGFFYTILLYLVLLIYINFFAIVFVPNETFSTHHRSARASIYDKRQNGNFCICSKLKQHETSGIRFKKKSKCNDERIAINLMSYCFLENFSPRWRSIGVCVCIACVCVAHCMNLFRFWLLVFFSFSSFVLQWFILLLPFSTESRGEN